ncbi:MAG TPA: pilus assembly protein N-terminal domain-containing protein [Caulobacteraceae bacterium]|jgi:Flp pilus assembly secretin CpaC|nr:pilus assembly protein N-terminal domain-containing protein [Caulobacteraceae bacterium]
MGLANRTAVRLAALVGLAALALTGMAADAASRVSVGVNQSVHLGVRGVAANVVISNPAVADVTMTDTHSIIVIGKGYGTTQVTVTDSAGHVLLDSVITVTSLLEGQMTLYRGGIPQRYNCAPRCEADSSDKQAGGGASAPAASGAPPAS